ncbi:MAG: hypothetical protein J6U79_01605 [Paludibacteraceae bacterium]|nr:hypothetical protein [Paludibacteraceae bacterium]
MKKVFLPVVLLCLATTMFAQKANISKAKTKAYNVEAPDPQGAKTLIEEALVHPETANQAKTWFEAGAISTKYNKMKLTNNVWDCLAITICVKSACLKFYLAF